jgi:hypothetical protein
VPKKGTTQNRYKCVFAGIATKPIDDRIQAAWKARFGQGAPFGSLRQTWRRQHCATVNPYGSDGCPFTIFECLEAFEDAVIESLAPQVLDSRVYFISVAKTTGMRRAENKPREEARISRTLTGPGLIGVVGEGSAEGRDRDLPPDGTAPDGSRPLDEGNESHLRPRLRRPVHIGTLLGSPDSRPREGSGGDGREEGAE